MLPLHCHFLVHASILLVHSVALVLTQFVNDPANCHYVLVSQSSKRAMGSLESPNYPSSYQRPGGGLIHCQYAFFAEKKTERIQIVFTHFNLYKKSRDSTLGCLGLDDRMTAYTRLPDGKTIEIASFCGEKAANNMPRVMSSGESLILTFDTRTLPADRRNQSGVYKYRFQYFFVDDFDMKYGDRHPDHDCAYHFTSDKAVTGHVYSPNFPGLYPKSTVCTYEFHGTGKEKIRLRFNHFDVDGTLGCEEKSDYLALTNYPAPVADKAIAKFCGQRSPPLTIQSLGRYFKLIFESNELFENTGFQAVYSFIDTTACASGISDCSACPCVENNELGRIACVCKDGFVDLSSPYLDLSTELEDEFLGRGEIDIEPPDVSVASAATLPCCCSASPLVFIVVVVFVVQLVRRELK
uniref:CUB domain-containing protein n=1 Tax=Plectus sambesii TaxID=2011161 RepID=A0A914WY07_9BILA